MKNGRDNRSGKPGPNAKQPKGAKILTQDPKTRRPVDFQKK